MATGNRGHFYFTNRVCVFAGSNQGRQPEYRAVAGELGRTLAQRGLGLVYGGARVGLHSKPCGLLNVEGYFDGLLTFIDETVSRGFVRQEYLAMLAVTKWIVDPAST